MYLLEYWAVRRKVAKSVKIIVITNDEFKLTDRNDNLKDILKIKEYFYLRYKLRESLNEWMKSYLLALINELSCSW